MAGILPKNVKKEKDITPKVFFIWGQSMSGKTYLARQFPDPIILNTDGNAKKVDTPSVEVFTFERFMGVIKELEEGKHDFKTVIIDLVDDIKTMLETFVLEKYKAESLADIAWGKGFNEVKGTWQRLMVRLSQLPYNVIYISHVATTTDDVDKEKVIEVPSLEQKYYNMCMGRSDVSIKCRKIGNNYSQLVMAKRDNYTVDDFKDKAVLEVIKDAVGLFARSTDTKLAPKTNKPAGGLKSLKKADTEPTPEPEEVSNEENLTKVTVMGSEGEYGEFVPQDVDVTTEAPVEEPVAEEPAKPLKTATKVAKKTAPAPTPAEDSTAIAGYYFDPNTAKYVTVSDTDPVGDDWIPVPKAIYEKATGVAKPTPTEKKTAVAEAKEFKTTEAPKKVAPKTLKPMAGKKV